MDELGNVAPYGHAAIRIPLCSWWIPLCSWSLWACSWCSHAVGVTSFPV